MILKIFKAVWFLSLLALLTSFLFIYASVPETIVVHEGEGITRISREMMFYCCMGLFALCNVLVFIVSALYRRDAEEFLCWFYGLIIALNLFFIMSLNFLHVYNSNEKFDYGRIGFIIYASVGLVLLWAAGWPFYSFFRKKEHKPVV